MTDLATLAQTLELGADDILRRTDAIHAQLLSESRCVTRPNFRIVHPGDLSLLFELCDDRFLGGACRRHMDEHDIQLEFRLSKRMTKNAGKTTKIWWHGSDEASYEITLSSTLLFQSFQNESRPIEVVGIACNNRLEAMQRVFEHELLHLVELLVWEESDCTARRFHSLASRVFGHRSSTHKLITPFEQAAARYGVLPGDQVEFEFERETLRGFVRRITKRATVLVEDDTGEPYDDGKRYLKYYVPLQILRKV